MSRRVLGSLAAAIFMLVLAGPAAHADTTTYRFINGPQSYTVPKGVHVLKVTARGAGGGGAVHHRGARGARVVSFVAVVPGEVLRVEVGRGGDAGAPGKDGEGSAVLGTGVRLLAGGGVWHGPEFSYGHDGVDGLPASRISRTGGHGGAIGDDGHNGTVAIATTKRTARFDPPRLGDVWPYVGSRHGGTELHLSGSGLHRVTKVLFGGVPGRDVLWLGGDELTVITPAHHAGTVPITLVSVGGRDRVPGAFRYL